MSFKQKSGFAVVDDLGVNVNTVADTRRAAIVNWLVVAKRCEVLNSFSDRQIEHMWDVNRGGAEVRTVMIVIEENR